MYNGKAAGRDSGGDFGTVVNASPRPCGGVGERENIGCRADLPVARLSRCGVASLLS